MRQKCEEAEHCVHARERMEECETRVGSRSLTEEECTEELFDFLHARDHCVSMTALTAININSSVWGICSKTCSKFLRGHLCLVDCPGLLA